MDITIALTFLEVVKAGSFIAAAESLHVSQTAVSARIRMLEQQLDRPVFVRNKAGARLTAEGERFYRFAATLVQVWEAARTTVALPPGRAALLTLGAEMSLWSPLLKHWLLWMRKECPDFAVRTTIDSGERLLALVQEGGLDAAVLYGAPRRPGLVAELLFEERLVLARTTSEAVAEEPVGISIGAKIFRRACAQRSRTGQTSRSQSVTVRLPLTTFCLSADRAISVKVSFARVWKRERWKSYRTAPYLPIPPILFHRKSRIPRCCRDCGKVCASPPGYGPRDPPGPWRARLRG